MSLLNCSSDIAVNQLGGVLLLGFLIKNDGIFGKRIGVLFGPDGSLDSRSATASNAWVA